jgi:hypothetical protein
LLPGEQLLLIKICGIFLDTGPGFCFIQALGNSEQWKMTGQADNVGFLATESGMEQLQLSLWGCFVLQCRRSFPELRSTTPTSSQNTN